MFAKFSGIDDSSWDMGCICELLLLLLESSVVPADDDDSGGGGGGTEVTGGTELATALLTVVVPGPTGCGAVGMVADTDGVPGICCCMEDSAGA